MAIRSLCQILLRDPLTFSVLVHFELGLDDGVCILVVVVDVVQVGIVVPVVGDYSFGNQSITLWILIVKHDEDEIET